MHTVLLIDDDEAILKVFGIALGNRGYRVITATSGDEGMALAREHLPDVIICDINMPGTDGRTVLQTLRADPKVSTRQIVLMTGNTTAVTQRAGMNLGADDFLVKPFKLEELFRCVAARLKRAELNRRVEDRVMAEMRSALRVTLPHEFFTPLAGILGLVEIVRSDLPNLKPEEIEDVLNDIEGCGRRLHRTLKNYLLALDLQAGIVRATPSLILSEAVRAVIDSAVKAALKRHPREADISVSIADCAIVAEPTDVGIIIEELVDNACSFSLPGTRIDVQFTSTASLIVKDRGRGMTPEQVAAIGAFHQFDRKKFEQQGLGLGLMLVHALADRNGAKVAIESTPGEGTTATVQFRVGKT